MEQRTPEIPLSVLRDRQPVLRRALAHLEEPLLEAMRQALDRHDGRLRHGQLYAREGGCAVGVMLCELFPASEHRRRGWRRPLGIYERNRELARQHPRLAHVEMVFDGVVQDAHAIHPEHSQVAWAQAAGRWIAGMICVELERRRNERLSRAELLAQVPRSWWADAHSRQRALAAAR